MCALVKIYKLIDPRNGEIRYVGKTQSKYLCERLAVHVRQSKNVVGKPSHKEAWIKNVLADGLKPRIELICEVDEKDWAAEEIKQIAHHKEMGCRLTNTSIGGDAGNLGGKHTTENKESVRKRMIGNKYAVGHKWTKEALEKRRNNPNWINGVRKAMLGKKHTDEWKNAASQRMSGENHPLRKLDKNKVNMIREKYRSGENLARIARNLQMNYRHIWKVATNKSWA